MRWDLDVIGARVLDDAADVAAAGANEHPKLVRVDGEAADARRVGRKGTPRRRVAAAHFGQDVAPRRARSRQRSRQHLKRYAFHLSQPAIPQRSRLREGRTLEDALSGR